MKKKKSNVLEACMVLQDAKHMHTPGTSFSRRRETIGTAPCFWHSLGRICFSREKEKTSFSSLNDSLAMREGAQP